MGFFFRGEGKNTEFHRKMAHAIFGTRKESTPDRKHCAKSMLLAKQRGYGATNRYHATHPQTHRLATTPINFYLKNFTKKPGEDRQKTEGLMGHTNKISD